MKYVFFAILASICLSCQQTPNSHETYSQASPAFVSQNGDPFKDYWYSGKAEISSYELTQARYGDLHPGYAVLIFVTEDFSVSKQVKLDNPPKSAQDKVSVLKLNAVKKFNTGIYQYSLMQSIFSPVDLTAYPHSLKTTTSVQDWCGHIFTQLNRRKDNYQMQAFSYFESEGDRKEKIEGNWLEDEVWNRIRLDYTTLPIGEISIIPSMIYSRLKHQSNSAQKANAALVEKDSEFVYSLSYPNRSLEIQFEKEFPHTILGWEETYASGFNSDAKPLKTTAKLKKIVREAYWSLHEPEDSKLRDELGLSIPR